MFKYRVTFANGTSASVDSAHEINGMPKEVDSTKKQHFTIVIPKYNKYGEDISPWGDFSPYSFVYDSILNDARFSTCLSSEVIGYTHPARRAQDLGLSDNSGCDVIAFEQLENEPIEIVEEAANTLFNELCDEIVKHTKAIGGTTYYRTQAWNQIYCFSEDFLWQYNHGGDELVLVNFIATQNADGMAPIEEQDFRVFIDRFNKHVSGPEPNFSEAQYWSTTYGEYRYDTVFIGSEVADRINNGEMTAYLQEDPVWFYRFSCDVLQ